MLLVCYIQYSTQPLSLFLAVARPLGKIYLSPQPSAAVKIRDSGHHFHKENSDQSFAKITPAQQAISIKVWGYSTYTFLSCILDGMVLSVSITR